METNYEMFKGRDRDVSERDNVETYWGQRARVGLLSMVAGVAIVGGIITLLSGCDKKGGLGNVLVGRGVERVEKIVSYKVDDFSGDSDRVLLARMLYGEGRNCGKDEKIAVGYSVMNRVDDGKEWNGETLRGVLLSPWQYSCFNEGDVNREKMKNPDRAVFDKCLEAADAVLAGKSKEFDKGQTHYFNPLTANPSWAKELEKIGKIGNSKHNFYIEN